MSELTSDQLRRVDAWIFYALNDFGTDRTWGIGATVEDWCPRFTDPGSPRSLLDRAIAKCVEKAGRDTWLCALQYVTRDWTERPTWEQAQEIWGIAPGFSVLDLMVRADAVTLCRALVLALGGNWEEAISE